MATEEFVANKQAYLLVGGPGVGKTTVIKEAVARMEGRAGGFYTEEIRAQGLRQGFKIVTLDGESATLAHMDIGGPYRVSRYGVDVGGLDRVGVLALRRAARERDVVVIDEIGKMELFSASFREAVLEALESGKKVLGTIMLGSHPWADEIKRRPEVDLIPITRMNRHQMLDKVLRCLRDP